MHVDPKSWGSAAEAMANALLKYHEGILISFYLPLIIHELFTKWLTLLRPKDLMTQFEQGHKLIPYYAMLYDIPSPPKNIRLSINMLFLDQRY